MIWNLPAPRIGCEGETCVCEDAEADRLREMVAVGVGQWEASRAIWGLCCE